MTCALYNFKGIAIAELQQTDVDIHIKLHKKHENHLPMSFPATITKSKGCPGQGRWEVWKNDHKLSIYGLQIRLHEVYNKQ